MRKIVKPSKIGGEVKVPASKSHTIRALIIGSLANGESVVHNPLNSSDTHACISACRAFGAEIQDEDPERWIIHGTGGQFQVPNQVIDIGNSGTTLYLILGLSALREGWTVFTGDEQIRTRSAGPLLQSIGDLGGKAFSTRGNGCAPLVIGGTLRGGTTTIECPTSQYLSGLLLCTPLLPEKSCIDVTLLNEQPYVEITLSWLDQQGIRYRNESFKRFEIEPNQIYQRFDRRMTGDFSSATFFLCAAALSGCELTVLDLDMEDSQGDRAVVEHLRAMGCKITTGHSGIIVEPGELKGCDLDLNATPDALPALAVTAAYASGTTRLLNVPQARIKETDRIAVMARELTKLGGQVAELPDGLVVHGSGGLRSGVVDGHGDHRIVMALAIAGLGADGPVTIEDVEAVSVTFPNFFELLESIRLK